jgi:DNA-binding NtrC family response regulator
VLHTYITLGKLDLMGQISMVAGADDGALEVTSLDGQGLRQRMDALEKKMILSALEAARWHRGRAAEALQLNYKTLQRKMKAHDIK